MTREELNENMQKEIEKEKKDKNRKKIVKILFKIIVFLTIILTIFFTYTTYVSTIKIKVREYRIKNKKIPNNFNGLKIIQLSDLHFGSTIFNGTMKKIRNMVNERNPDIIIFTGDLINKNYNLTSEEQEALTQELKKLNAKFGKYAILGDEDNENISTIFNQSDFTLLKNEYDLIYKDNNNPILLIGISSIKNNQNIDEAYNYFKNENINQNIYTITMIHEPDIVDNILSNYSTDLFLAGHSHNGNIRIPFMKYSPFKVENAIKYDQDYYEINDSKLYISSGLGTPKGIRLFCRPSINFYRLSNK